MSIGSDSLGSFSFTGADGSALGGGWTNRQGLWTIQSNQASYALGQSVSALSCYNNIARANDNYRVSFALGNLGDGLVKGVMLRRSNGTGVTNNAYVLGVDDVGHAFIWKLVNDVATTVVDGGYQGSNFDGTFQAEADGTTLTLKNGAGTVLATATDSTYSSGDIGLFTNRVTSAATPFDAVVVTGTSSSPAATISTPTPSGVIGTQTTATLGATTNQGTAGSNNAYAVWSTSNVFGGVTATQVKAGQNASGSTSGVSNSGAVAITSTAISIPISGLSAGTTYYYAITQTNANGDSNVVTGSFTTAAATTSVTVGLGASGSPLASTACKFWTKNTLDGAAVDGGSGGISGTTDASGNITLSGLTIAAGAKYLQFQVGTDPLNVHVVPVTYA